MGVEWLAQELCLEKDRTVPEATPTFKENPGKPWKNTGRTVLKVAMKWSNRNFHQPDSLQRLLRFSNILKVSSWCFFHTERCQWSPDVLSIRTVSSFRAEWLHRHTRNLGFSILFSHQLQLNSIPLSTISRGLCLSVILPSWKSFQTYSWVSLVFSCVLWWLCQAGTC